jgi:hypothetical protein
MGTPNSTRLSHLLTHLALAAAPMALGGLVFTAGMPAVAHAQSAFAAPVVELLPVGDVIADGTSSVWFHVLALETSGAPLSGMSARLAVSDGQGVTLTESAPGVYSGLWTPKAAAAAGTVQVTLKGKAGKTNINKAWALNAAPPMTGAIAGAANPTQLILGQDATASVSFTLSGPAAAAAKAGDLAVNVSSGTVTNVTALGSGSFSALYTPPPQAFPQLAVITVTDRRDPAHATGTVVVPLVGKAAFPVVGMPNSRIIMKVGDREFGPVAADATGRAQVPIIVPPGVASASVVSILGDKKTEEPINLQVPPSKRLSLFPVAGAIPADPGSAVGVRLFVTKPDGTPDVGATVTFTASAGAVSPASHIGNGVYESVFTPTLASAPSQVTLTAAVADTAVAQSDTMTIDLVPARPAGLALTPEPAALPAGAMAFKVFAKLTDANGQGISGQTIGIEAEGAKLNGQVRDLGSGDYQAALATGKSTGDIRITGSARLPASGNPLARVLAFADSERLDTAGNPSTAITIVTVDAFGLPVGNVPVTVNVVQGGGTAPAAITSDENGLARVRYTGGGQAGLAHIQVAAGGHSAGVAILQAPAGAAKGVDLPIGGSADQQRLTAAWDALVSDARVTQAPAAGMAVRTTAGPTVAARLDLTADPASIAPGGAVVLRVTARDAAGMGVAGQVLTVQTSAGQVGPVQDTGGGSYQATFQAPADVTGSVQLAITTADGGVAAFLDLPVAAGSAAAWGVGDTTTPVAEEPPKEPREPREPGDYPWLRLSAGYLGGMYSYQQSPSTQQGPLYSRTITVGGGEGSAAGMAGIQVHGRAYVPGLEYLGFDLGFRTSNWSIELAEGFDEPIPDWNNEFSGRVIGRYPVDFDGGRVHIGAKVGLDVNDFLYFTQEDNADGGVDLLYQQLIVPGPVFGLELGTEIGPVFAIGSYEAGFTDFDGTYSHNLDLDLGVGITDNFFVQADAGWNIRETAVYAGADKSEVGTVGDSFTMFGLELGFQL